MYDSLFIFKDINFFFFDALVFQLINQLNLPKIGVVNNN